MGKKQIYEVNIWRNWVSTAIAGAIAVVSAASPALWPNLPKGLWASVLIIALLGIVIAMPRRRKAPSEPIHLPQEAAAQPTSAFIRGDVSDSSIDQVKTNADFFIDGELRSSRIGKIDQNKRGFKP